MTGTLRTAAGWGAVFVALLLLPLLFGNLYHSHLAVICMINVLLAVGLNIVKGFAGQVTIGHIGLYAVGAYTSALLSINLGMPFLLAFPAAVAVTALFGVIIGLPSFRLEGAYLALATLGLGESIRITISVTDFLGSTLGIGEIPAPVFFGVELSSPDQYYYLVMPVTVLMVLFSFRLLNSVTGRAFKAMRDDPLAAEAAGINVKRYKLLAFVISAVYAGMAGSLYAHLHPGYIHPNNFTIIEMITLLLMVVLGGIGNIWGGIIGAVLVTLAYDFTRDYYQYQLLIFGLAIVLTVMFMPNGIGGYVDRALATRRFVLLREKKSRAS